MLVGLLQHRISQQLHLCTVACFDVNSPGFDQNQDSSDTLKPYLDATGDIASLTAAVS